MAKMQKVIAVIGMMAAMVFGFNSCTKFEMEDPGQTTSWAAPKKLEQKVGKTVWEELSEKFSFFAKFEKGGNTLYETSYERPFGAYGEATKVVIVENESELSGVKYAEGKLSEQKSEWDAKNGWWGTQVTRTQNFRLANAKYGADYSDSWYSTGAYFEKDTLKAEFPDAVWNRNVKLDSTKVYNKAVDEQKGYYKVRDFIATVTSTASIKDGFVKDATKAVKTFTMKDTLSLRFYVEPDPDDRFDHRWSEVELYREGEKIIAVWTVYEHWTGKVEKDIEVHRESLDFTAWAKGSDNNPVYPTNTAYQISSEKWNGTGNKAIATTSSNGIKADEFKTHFEVYGDKSVTLTYEDQSVTFNAELVQEATRQSISGAQLTNINGVYYNISVYTAEIMPVYTVTAGEKSAQLELSAKGETQLRVKANANVKVEDQKFIANFKAEGAKLYHEDGQYANLWDEVEYTETVETGRNHIVRPLILSGEVNGVDGYEVDDESKLGKLQLSTIKGSSNSTSKKDGNFTVKTTVATVTATFDNKKTQTIDFKVTSETTGDMTLGYAAIDFDKISCKIDTVRVSESSMRIEPKYTVPVKVTGIDGKTKTDDYVIYNPFYETVKAKPQDKVDTTYTPSVKNGELVVLVERVVNDKDRTTIREDKYTPNFGITAQSAKDMYGKNYATTYNGTRNVKTNNTPNGYWTVENTKGQMTSTLSNGADSDDNIADYEFDSKVTYTDGDYSYTFAGSMALSNSTDALVPAGTKTINNTVYNVSDYQENFNGVYTIDGEEIGKPADAVKRQILVEVVTTTEIENQRYEAVFETSGANLTTKVNANSWDVVTYTDGVETGRKTETHPLEVSATISGGTNFSVASKDNLNKEYKITSVTRTGNQVSTVTENGVKKERTIQNFSATVNNGQTLNVRVVTEEDLTPDMTLSHTYCETVKQNGVDANVSGNTVTLTPKVNVMLVQDNGVATKAATGEAKPYTIEDSMVGTYTPETKVVRVPSIENGKPVVRTYNDVDGERTLVDTEEFTPYYALTSEDGKDVIAENTNFVTTFNGTSNTTSGTGTTQGHFTSTRENGKVTSTMSNGSVKADNIGNYSYDKTIVYKNGNDTFTFNGSANLTENTDAITANGTKTIDEVTYNAFAYKTTFNMAYAIDEATVGTTTIGDKSASVSRDILVEKEVPVIVIDKGKIKSIDITATPGHSTGNERFADGNDRQEALKNFAIHTETGVYNVQCVMSDIIPSENQLKNTGTFTAGDYDAYNSACDRGKNGVWVPAKTEDASDALRWRLEDGKARSVRLESLQQWNWRDGNYSTVVTGYTYSVKDGVLTLKYNGEVVVRIK